MKGLLSKLFVFVVVAALLVSCAPAATPAPTAVPTALPIVVPTKAPTTAATVAPTVVSTVAPTKPPGTAAPTAAPTITSAPGATKLTLWHPYSGNQQKLFESMINDFNKANPTIQVVPTYGGSLFTMRDKLLTAIAGNVAPDISIIDQFWGSELADAKAILTMEDFINAEKDFDKTDVYDFAWKTAIYNGKIWSMPFSASNEVLYYNKALFTKAGLDPNKPPATWTELLAAAKKLTLDTNNDGKTDQWGISLVLKADLGCVYDWLIFNWANGGALFSDDFKKSRFNEAPGVEALQFYVDMVNKDKVMPLEPPASGFENGLIAMTIASTSRVPTYINVHKDNLGVAMFPKQKVQATSVGGANLAIFTATKNKALAWTFVKWMTSSENNLRWSMESGYNPLRKSVVASAKYQEFLKADARYKVVIDQMQYAIVRPNIPAYSPGSREIGLAVEEAVFGNKDPKTVLDAAAKKVDVLLGQ